MAQLKMIRVVDIPAEAYDWFLEPMQFAIVEVRGDPKAKMLADRETRRLVVAHVNKLGGVCDDCQDFRTIDLLTVVIYEVIP